MMNYKSSKGYRLGMRNLKTAIAVLISLLIGKYVVKDDSFFIVAAAMLSMESSLVNSFEVGKNRVLGTVLGALLGMAFASWQPGSFALTSLGILLLIYVLNLMKWNKSIIIASFVFLGIMMDRSEDSVFMYALGRTVDTLIGIGVGLGVNYLIYPYRFDKTLDNKAKELQDLIRENLERLYCRQEPLELEGLKDVLDSYEGELADYRVEVGMKKRHEADLQHRKEMFDDFDAVYTHMKVLDSFGAVPLVNEESAEKLAELDVEVPLEQVQSTALPGSESVYDYHTRLLLKKIEELQALEVSCSRNKA